MGKQHELRPSPRVLGGMLCLGPLLTLVACVQIPADAGFDDLELRVGKRVPQVVHWYRGGAEDAEVHASVDQLLQGDLSLDAAVQIALLRNRHLQATYQDLGVAQAELVQAGLLANPIFDGELLFGHEGEKVIELTLLENFLQVFSIPLRKATAASEFEAAKAKVEGAILQLACETKLAFFNVQWKQQALQLIEREVEASSASLEGMRRLYAAGNMADLDLFQNESLYHGSKKRLAMAHMQLAGSREALTRLMGLWGVDCDWSITAELAPLPASPLPAEDVERRALQASLDLALPRAEIEALAHSLGLTRDTSWIADLEAGIKFERAGGEWEYGPLLEVSLPIFDQGQARKLAARSRLQKQQEMLLALAIDLRSMARLKRDEYIGAWRMARFYRDAVMPLQEKILHAELLNYNAMQIGVFDLMLAKKRELRESEQALEALKDYWIAHAEFETLMAGKMIGGMDAEPASSMDSGMASDSGGGH